MKILLVVFLNILSFCAIGQMSLDEQELDLLEKEKVYLEKEIKKIKLIYDSLNTNLKRVARQKQLLESSNNSFSIKATLKMNGYIYPEPNYDTEKIGKILKNQSVTLISYSPGYFLIDEPRGYLLALALNNNKEIEILLESFEKQKKIADEERERKLKEIEKSKKDSLWNIEYQIEQERLKELSRVYLKEREKEKELKKLRIQEEEKKQLEERKAMSIKLDRYTKQYGEEIAYKLIGNQYWIGMTDEMARLSLGYPKDVNRTVGIWGTSEQWVYSMDLMLYFENGILKNYQN